MATPEDSPAVDTKHSKVATPTETLPIVARFVVAPRRPTMPVGFSIAPAVRAIVVDLVRPMRIFPIVDHVAKDA
jgi:hypothetical protein